MSFDFLPNTRSIIKTGFRSALQHPGKLNALKRGRYNERYAEQPDRSARKRINITLAHEIVLQANKQFVDGILVQVINMLDTCRVHRRILRDLTDSIKPSELFCMFRIPQKYR